ncbi:MAG: PLDc_N domain-containing protein [Planctomycetaceae bacterium]|nr:PLDc_N domain-containing protein [Planctomycetaceae bacterium]
MTMLNSILPTLNIFAQNAMPEVALWGGGLFMLIAGLLALAAVVIWVWALVDAIRNPALDDTMRIVWVLVIVFTQIVGALIYLVIGRSRSPRMTHR